MRFSSPPHGVDSRPERRPALPYSLVAATARAEIRIGEPDPALFTLKQLDVAWDERSRTLWTYMRPDGRPCYNTNLLADFHKWQALIKSSFDRTDGGIRYLVLGSRTRGVFSLGGDLKYFLARIRDRDRSALVEYGRSCVRILHRNLEALKLPVVTIGLAQGDALGGGLESLLSFDVIVAERGARFGLPENLFGLFPGMGAHSFLMRRLGVHRAADMILHGATFTAQQMYDWGIVHVLAEPGEGVQAVQKYIDRNVRRHRAHVAVYEGFRIVDPISLSELEQIVDLWAETALSLKEQDLRLMERLASAQDRLSRAR